MRKNFGAKPYIYPQPVLMIATYDEKGNVDVMNAAWGGTYDTDKIVMCLSASHKTVKNIKIKKAFTVSMGTSKYVKECDYAGMISANNEPDKFNKTGFTTTKSSFVDAPIINELYMTFECVLDKYDDEDEICVGKVINVSIDESVLDENGKVDVKKLDPITFDPVNHVYLTLGEKVGNAFKDGLELK